MITWGRLEDEDDSNNRNKFLLFSGWYSLLTFYGCCVTFFCMFQFITEVPNFRFYSSLVSGKKRERSDDNDEEKVEHSSKKNQKEKLEKELADPQKTRN